MSQAIVAPLCAYTLLLFGLWGLLGAVRVTGGLRRTIPLAYLRTGEGPRPADWIVDLHHHFSNHFEVPVLFYAGAILALVAGTADGTVVALAWAFVVLRVIHTVTVLAGNDPRIRVTPYVLSGLCVFGIWLRVFTSA